jgi:ankyrin repeat protein
MKKFKTLATACLSASLVAPTWAAPIHDAARAGDGAAIAQLLRDGADINEQDETGETALFAAALAAMPKIIDQLMVAGADAAIRNDRGMTAVHAAAFGGNPEAVSLLVGDAKFTARVDLNDHDNKFGVTPLIIAAEEDEGDVLAHLIGLDADLEITERHGYTALTRAAYHGHDQIVTILLRSGAQCQTIDPVWHVECTRLRGEMGLQ